MNYGFLALYSFSLIAFWYLSPYLVRRWEVNNWRRQCRMHRIVVLTFDDGPGRRLTPKVVSLLRQMQIPATFFFIGKRTLSHPESAQEAKNAGFEIGSHTSRHRNAWKSIPLMDCYDLLRGWREVSTVVGQTRLFRPPYGKMTIASYVLARVKRMHIAWWTIDARDSLETPKPHSEVLNEIQSNSGGIILLHDYDSFPDPNHEFYVLELIEKINIYARQAGLRFMTFGEFVALERKKVQL